MKQHILAVSLAVGLLANSAVAERLTDYVPPLPLPPPQNCEYWSNLQISARVCKRQASVTYEERSHYFASADFSWRCNAIGNLEFDFFNSTSHTVSTIVIEGTTSGIRLSENVHVPPGQSKYVYVLSSGSFCAREQTARLYFNFRVADGGECLATYSTVELQNMQDTCRTFQTEQRGRDRIYNNCFIERSRGADRTAIGSVRNVCRQISENPTMLQRWRWGD